jgi:nicotinate-nucleotide pyrophosphorylase (carboxylating)
MTDSVSLRRIKQVKNTHACTDVLKMSNPGYRRYIFGLLNRMIFDDVDDGDITMKLIRDLDCPVSATIKCKSDGVVLAGLDEIKRYFEGCHKNTGHKISVTLNKKDSSVLSYGETVAMLSGNYSDILRVERTVLNFIQRMSGLATAMHELASRVSKFVLVTGTRKTLWGLADKKAFMTGGGGSHRLNLADAILIKNNHIAAVNNDIPLLVGRLNRLKKRGRFAEIEISSLNDAKTVLDAYDGKYPLYLMFDNMKPEKIKKVLKKLNMEYNLDHVFFEASGGINLKNIARYAASGVDIVSVGAALSRSQPADFNLTIKVL